MLDQCRRRRRRRRAVLAKLVIVLCTAFSGAWNVAAAVATSAGLWKPGRLWRAYQDPDRFRGSQRTTSSAHGLARLRRHRRRQIPVTASQPRAPPRRTSTTSSGRTCPAPRRRRHRPRTCLQTEAGSEDLRDVLAPQYVLIRRIHGIGRALAGRLAQHGASRVARTPRGFFPGGGGDDSQARRAHGLGRGRRDRTVAGGRGGRRGGGGVGTLRRAGRQCRHVPQDQRPRF